MARSSLALLCKARAIATERSVWRPHQLAAQTRRPLPKGQQGETACEARAMATERSVWHPHQPGVTAPLKLFKPLSF